MRAVFRKDTDCALTAPPPFHPLPAVSSSWVPTHLTDNRTHRNGASRYREDETPRPPICKTVATLKTVITVQWQSFVEILLWGRHSIENLMCLLKWDSPGSSDGKESACTKPRFSPWVGKIPWRKKWLSTLVFLPRGAWWATVLGWQRVGYD